MHNVSLYDLLIVVRRWGLDAQWKHTTRLGSWVPERELQFHQKSIQAMTTFTRTGTYFLV